MFTLCEAGFWSLLSSSSSSSLSFLKRWAKLCVTIQQLFFSVWKRLSVVLTVSEPVLQVEFGQVQHLVLLLYTLSTAAVQHLVLLPSAGSV